MPTEPVVVTRVKVLGTSPPGHPHVKRECWVPECQDKAVRSLEVTAETSLKALGMHLRSIQRRSILYVCKGHAKLSKDNKREILRHLL